MVTDKMTMTARESAAFKKSKDVATGQRRVAKEYADRTGHTIELWATEADGTETLVDTFTPAAT